MPRPSKSHERRAEFLPIIARAFAELGYRRATTAELAKRCQVRENILFRLWADKKQMFLASVDHIYALSTERWNALLEREGETESSAERVLDYESDHHGEFGHYRIIFAGLNETDDPDIRAALQGMYKRFHELILKQVAGHKCGRSEQAPENPQALADADLLAWAFIGLGTVASITKELGLITSGRHKRLIRDVGRILLESGAP